MIQTEIVINKEINPMEEIIINIISRKFTISKRKPNNLNRHPQFKNYQQILIICLRIITMKKIYKLMKELVIEMEIAHP